jgi:hypothetical protein
MRNFRVLIWCFASGLVLFLDQTAGAAWNNVFQVTCHRCRDRSSSSYFSSYAAPAPYVANAPADPCCEPCQTCTTRYVQKTYYQQVTHYETRTYYEPRTTYRTSYYWEPVVSYRYTSYFDPTTCCYKQQACPTTSYRLRSQCCPVQSFVARCCTVPVTSLKPVCYVEPQTVCAPVCPTPCPDPCAPGAAPGMAIPAQPDLGTNPAPGVREDRIPGAGVGGTRDQDQGNPYEAQRISPREYMPRASGQSLRQYPQQTPPPPKLKPTAPPAQPKVTFDRIAAVPATNVEGDVVADSKEGVRVLFKSADRTGVSQYVTSDERGHFQASLASGKWLVYTHDSNNKPVLQAKFEVSDKDAKSLKLIAN